LATTSVTRLLGGTPAPVLRDWEMTVPARYPAVDRYRTVPLSPRPASAALALARVIPTSLGTFTAGAVVGGAAEVVGSVDSTLGGRGVAVDAGAGCEVAPLLGSASSLSATAPSTTTAAGRTTYQRRHGREGLLQRSGICAPTFRNAATK
jgi:hypothetical protein